MCDISIKTKLRTKTVYKVVFKERGKYYGLFSGMLIRPGIVPTKKRKVHQNLLVIDDYKKSSFYNKLMIGRISGFQHKNVAKKLFNDNKNEVYNICVLRVVLSGSIYKGTGANISSAVSPYETTFAGSEIFDFKEV
jgi:hypothetical protein